MSAVDEWAAIAPVYDLWSSDMTADVPFYVSEARAAGGTVLEIGVGTGRVSSAMARAGIDVVGVDNSLAMLAIAERRLADEESSGSVELLVGDMRDLDLGERRFSLAILPYRVLAHALTAQEVLSTLASVRRHLLPGGRMVFNLPVPRAQDLRDEEGLRRDGRFELEDGTQAVLWRQTAYAPGSQQIRFDFVVDHLDDSGVVVKRVHSEMTVRQNSPGELDHALALSGFDLVDRWGWFDRRPYDEESPEMVWAATRKDSWRR
ncbi:MAG: SAM-dependent methyltransferase [Glaciecola sp.]